MIIVHPTIETLRRCASLPPGRYFRMHMGGYFEGIASERGIAWRYSDSMLLRDFLRLENREEVSQSSRRGGEN